VSEQLAAALAWQAAGVSVVPTRTDGSKAPIGTWKEWTTARADTDQLHRWLDNGHPGIGLVTGTISGNLELLELEGRAVAEGAVQQITELITAAGLADLWVTITGHGYAERTPSGGLHILYRVDQAVPGNEKLAQRPARADELTDRERDVLAEHPGKVFPRVLAETRGEGGYVVIAPSNGATHPTGQGWTVAYGQAGAVPTITAEQRTALHTIFRTLDRMPPPIAVEPATRPLALVRDGELRPGDDYEARTGWHDILTPHGWRPLHRHGERTYWRRPGKDTPGISGTTGGAADGRDRLYVFSSSTEFPTEQPITKFEAYAILEHGGDRSAAARELRRLGYGSPLPSPGEEQRAAFADLLPPKSVAAGVLSAVDGTAARELATPAEPHRIKLENDADTIRVVQAAINDRRLPNVYVTNGALVELTPVSGDASAAGLSAEDQPPLPVISATLTTDGLAALLAEHTYTYELRKAKDTYFEEETLPPARALAAVLSRRQWRGVQPLHGIVGSPVLRPDGTLLQQSGYDPATGLYLASRASLPVVPEKPTEAQAASARQFLLGRFLGDFPWVAEADRANYIGLLVAQIIRPYLRALTPFGLISASTQSSGKTILSEGIGLLYGQRVRPWVRNEAEQRKAITAVLDESAATIVFDNVREGEAIVSPVLAMLVTSPTWSDRLLGTNTTFTAVNDRLWLATGNNLRLGGDMATRTVLVRLDPKMPRPELRDPKAFGIPDLDQWVKHPANRSVLLGHLLVLVMDWIAAGAPRAAHAMRQFTTWAAATGGLLAHHGIAGFLDNVNDVRDLDEDDSEWATFLHRWHELFGDARKLARDVRASADVDFTPGEGGDRWGGAFLSDDDGRLPSAKSLGRILRGHIGRFRGEYVLRSKKDEARNALTWWVEKHGEGQP
jgi:hypothetical protein